MSEGLASFSSSSYTYDELVAGETITVSGVILTGQGALIRGTILGKDGATGKWSRTVHPSSGILVHDVDTTAGDVTAPVHVKGEYKDNVVVLPPATTIAVARAELWMYSIHLLDVQE